MKQDNSLDEKMILTIRKRYRVMYYDLDSPKADVWLIVKANPYIKESKVYRTKKGYHIKAYLKGSISGGKVFYYMLRSGVDPLYIWMFLISGRMTLFKIRRGKLNERRLRR